MSPVKTTKTGAFVVHSQGEDGSDAVCIGALRVVISHEADGWFAQGIEIDYAASGSTLEEVKDNFAEGLMKTVGMYIERDSSIDDLLKFAPRDERTALLKDINSASEHLTIAFQVPMMIPDFPFDSLAYVVREDVVEAH